MCEDTAGRMQKNGRDLNVACDENLIKISYERDRSNPELTGADRLQKAQVIGSDKLHWDCRGEIQKSNGLGE